MFKAVIAILNHKYSSDPISKYCILTFKFYIYKVPLQLQFTEELVK